MQGTFRSTGRCLQGLGTSALQRESRRIQACTPQETAVQLEHFKEHLGGIKDFSACGAGSWMRKYHELAPKGPRVRHRSRPRLTKDGPPLCTSARPPSLPHQVHADAAA